MKKISVLSAICLMAVANFAFGQTHTQSFTFDDLGLGGGTANSGTYNQNDTFSFDVYFTFAGYDCYAYDLWLETQTLNNFAGSLSITGFTYGTAFPDPIQTMPDPAHFDASSGASPGYRTETRDMGALSAPKDEPFLPKPPGTYLIGHVSFTMTDAQLGTYTLRSTTVSPHTCIATSFDGTNFHDNPIPAATYTITIVPEPSTVALLVFIAIGLGATFCRRTISKKSRS